MDDGVGKGRNYGESLSTPDDRRAGLVGELLMTSTNTPALRKA
jgi:hypothetical protein